MPFTKQFKTKAEYNAWFQNYRDENREKIRAYNREYNREYRKRNGYGNEENSRKRYPEKVRARRILRYAVRNLLIKKLPCKDCGKSNSQAHHNDYSKPLEVLWLCPLHHTRMHK